MTIEVMKQAVDALEKSIDNFPANAQHQNAITSLRQAISQPDCRGCKNLETVEGDDDWEHYCAHPCTNGDKFQAMPKVVLYKVT